MHTLKHRGLPVVTQNGLVRLLEEILLIAEVFINHTFSLLKNRLNIFTDRFLNFHGQIFLKIIFDLNIMHVILSVKFVKII